jgi:hypothetical protein
VTCTTDAEVTYYIYSTALGGAKLVELSVMGDKVRGYVYGGGGRLAKQDVYSSINSYAVKWHHQNAGTPSWVETAADRSFERQEMDPLGAEVGTHDPYLYTPNPTYSDIHGGAPLYVEGGDPFDISNGCIMDDVPVPCGAALRAVQGGGASVVWVSPFGSAGRRGGTGGFTYEVVQTWEDYSIPDTINNDPVRGAHAGTSGSRLVNQLVAVPTAGPLGGQITPRPLTPVPQNPALPVDTAITNARKAIQEIDSCKDLFKSNGYQEAIKLLDKLEKNGGIIVDANAGIPVDPWGTTKTLSEARLAGAAYDGKIYLNPDSPELKDDYNSFSKHFKGNPLATLLDPQGNLSRNQFLTATIIHELLHLTGDIPLDMHSAGLSLKNQQLAVARCIRGIAPKR